MIVVRRKSVWHLFVLVVILTTMFVSCSRRPVLENEAEGLTLEDFEAASQIGKVQIDIKPGSFPNTIDLNANDILKARSLSFDSWESFTSIGSNNLPATRSYVALNVSVGATINTITWGGTDSGEQLVIIRNINSTAVTITHNVNNLRLLSAADISLTHHRAVVFASVDGTIWQHIGGLPA